MKRLLLGVVMAMLWMSCTTLQAMLYRAPPLPPTPPSTLRGASSDGGAAGDGGQPAFAGPIPGPLLRGLTVAVNDFASRSNPYSEYPLTRCLSRPETYDAEVLSEASDFWIIYVRPRGERCFEGGERLRGADATYQVRKTDFQILSAEFGE